MARKMTWEQMKQEFPDEWLLIVDFDTDESGHLTSGVVERHSEDMDKVVRPPVLSRPIAFRYTGESTFMGLRSHAQHHCNL